jgi:probable rRNA maturation factor
MGRRPKQKSHRPPKNTFHLVISVYNRQKDLKIDKSSVQTLVCCILEHLKVSPEEVSIYLVTKKEISKLHGQFFQDPTPTDCISFPLDDKHLGEVFVCPKVAIEYAQKKGLDPYRETTLYIIHGLLHLVGYDDLEPAPRKAMRKKEKSCMRQLDKLQIQCSPSS